MGNPGQMHNGMLFYHKGCHLVTRTDEEGIAGACAKFNKPGTERQAPRELTQMYNLTKLT